VLGGFFIFAQAQSSTKEQEQTPAPVVDAQLAVGAYDPFVNVRISAKAAIVKDLRTNKVLYEKNAYEPLPLASITKVVTALTATEILAEYSKGVVQIEFKHLEPEGDDTLIPGEHFTTTDLLNYTLVSSSNDGARALASVSGAFLMLPDVPQTPEEAFIARMNTVAAKVGMKDTRFFNESGLDANEEAREAGAIGSARDVAALFDYVLDKQPALLEATRANALTVRSKEGYVHHLENTNEAVGNLPNILGSKTGFTYTAGGNLAVVIDPSLNQPIVIVVLGSSKEGRFKDVERLTAATLEQLALSN
jgi:D-alanyl-D-alanine carboxypeptidase